MEEKYIGFCVKCKTKVEIKNPEPYEMKGIRGKRNAIKGVCPDCGTKVFRIIKNKEEK